MPKASHVAKPVRQHGHFRLVPTEALLLMRIEYEVISALPVPSDMAQLLVTSRKAAHFWRLRCQIYVNIGSVTLQQVPERQ